MTLTFEPQTLTLPQAAQMLGIGRATAYDLVHAGTFPVPVLRIGKRLRVPREPLERFVKGEATS